MCKKIPVQKSSSYLHINIEFSRDVTWNIKVWFHIILIPLSLTLTPLAHLALCLTHGPRNNHIGHNVYFSYEMVRKIWDFTGFLTAYLFIIMPSRWLFTPKCPSYDHHCDLFLPTNSLTIVPQNPRTQTISPNVSNWPIRQVNFSSIWSYLQGLFIDSKLKEFSSKINI